LAELGRGGMGVVYRARDKTLGRDVAVKVLSTMGVPEEVLDRFQREARAAAVLDHPHIVKVLDVGELPSEDARGRGRPFYAMELLHGEDLAHAIGTNQLPPRIAVEVVRQIASALGYAHQKGVLHRDVKPANIWLLRNPGGGTTVPAGSTTEATWHVHALLLDFGLARLLDKGVAQTTGSEGLGGWLTLTESGQLLGTPVYMSPEQVRGAHDVDGRADVYSLGATLYHALTGRPPFTGPTLTYLLDAVRRDDPVPPRKLNPAVPRDLDTLCLACLAKDPSRRYKTAEDLAEDCRRFLAGESLLARPPGPAERGMRWAKRRPIRAALLAAAIILGSGVGFR
ncbi:MAG: serine/threonine-protein kinase, partial [Planctomycetota bacterium]